MGTPLQWENIEISDSYIFEITNTYHVNVYYYIENEQEVPNDGGNYWHYDTDGITPIAW